ncbi:MarR family transcriptional regulator [Pseudonocardia sp. GCM10023141]|uniref:MarR family transcriptional regulator n=1 Tax=Pseudonocardia sp. GCM10023141 TaxID=3252653 RepID=UPI00360E85C0
MSPSLSTTDSRLLVLHLLRLTGFVAAERIARDTGLTGVEVVAVLDGASSAGHATERTGRISGWTLTAAGRAAHAALLAEELEQRGARADVEVADRAFVTLNEPFKVVCSRWQLRPDGTVNDHQDPSYDAAVVAELEPVHEQVVALTTRLAAALPRFGRYPRAFAAARERLLAGDRRAFAAPLSESYHDAWMELHQDLLSTLGRERSTADGH